MPERIIRFQLGEGQGAGAQDQPVVPRSVLTAHVGEYTLWPDTPRVPDLSGRGNHGRLINTAVGPTPLIVRAFVFILDPTKAPTDRELSMGETRAWVPVAQHSQMSGMTQTRLAGGAGMQLVRWELPEDVYLRYYVEYKEANRRYFQTVLLSTTPPPDGPTSFCLEVPGPHGALPNGPIPQIESTRGRALPRHHAFVQGLPGKSGQFWRAHYRKELPLGGQSQTRYVYLTRTPLTWIVVRQDRTDQWKRWTVYQAATRPAYERLCRDDMSLTLVSRYMTLQNALVELALFAEANHWALDPWEVVTIPH